MPRLARLLPAFAVTLPLLWAGGSAAAQTPGLARQTPPRYYPLRADMPPGINACFNAAIRPAVPGELAFVRLVLPSVANVEVYGGAPVQPIPLPAAWCGLGVGTVYRFRVWGLDGYPGIELYPSIELLDNTHPPRGREGEFAIPVRLSVEEINLALSGRLVTKVVYVEQPQIASSLPTEDGLVVETLTPDYNLIQEADRRGRAVAIVRLGARTPDTQRPDPEFYGPGGPVAVPPAQPGVAPEEN